MGRRTCMGSPYSITLMRELVGAGFTISIEFFIIKCTKKKKNSVVHIYIYIGSHTIYIWYDMKEEIQRS
jgi:hypothetical protein